MSLDHNVCVPHQKPSASELTHPPGEAEMQAKPQSIETQRIAFQAGPYEVRLAESQAEIEAAQALRYRVFYEENHGQPTAEMVAAGREIDEWDDNAFHIIVTNHKNNDEVVGTLRLVSNQRLNPGQAFYTEKAFNLEKLRTHYSKILELSRYCISADGRSGTILMLIWKFAMKFIIDNQYQLMIGCASFHDMDIDKHIDILSFLHKHNPAPEHLCPTPVVANHVHLDTLDIDQKNVAWETAKSAVPTLLRGYLKLGARISDCAIIDPVFNSVFVCIYVDAADMLRDNHTLVPK
jgi:putative hemolysin